MMANGDPPRLNMQNGKLKYRPKHTTIVFVLQSRSLRVNMSGGLRLASL